jgi:hypothetical protein
MMTAHTNETATARVLVEEIVPAIGALLVAIERLTVALALDAVEAGKLPPPRKPARKRKPVNRRSR